VQPILYSKPSRPPLLVCAHRRVDVWTPAMVRAVHVYSGTDSRDTVGLGKISRRGSYAVYASYVVCRMTCDV